VKAPKFLYHGRVRQRLVQLPQCLIILRSGRTTPIVIRRQASIFRAGSPVTRLQDFVIFLRPINLESPNKFYTAVSQEPYFTAKVRRVIHYAFYESKMPAGIRKQEPRMPWFL
jgi:hypothetical protein